MERCTTTSRAVEHQFRAQDQRQGDDGPLAHPAAQLVRIGVQEAQRELYALEHLPGALQRLVLGVDPVRLHGV
jgi:hypothetical protein